MFDYTVIGDEKKLLAIGKLTKHSFASFLKSAFFAETINLTGILILPYLVEWKSDDQQGKFFLTLPANYLRVQEVAEFC